jgi:prolipoprotein diacylglyceryl transferase
MTAVLAAIPSPSQGQLELGPLPLRGYALMIILGIVVAVVVTERRLLARGGPRGAVVEVATWAVPAGIVGGRLYHVVSSPQAYFGAGGDPLSALAVWKGGLGVWGAIAGGALGGYLACRRAGIDFPTFADAAAPGIALAQAVGRWGNWFNQELYGRPTDLPWAVEITRDPAVPGETLYHPTFLYESLWCVGVALACLWADRRFRLDRGRVFALYVALYCAGRAWIEALRIDEANRVLGLRLNLWVSLLVFLTAVGYLWWRRPRRRRPDPAPTDPPGTAAGRSLDG